MFKNLLKLKLLFLGLVAYILFTAPNALAYTLEIKLPGLPAAISDPGEYVRYLFIFGLSLAGFLAVGAVAVGGVQYITSASIPNTQNGKDLIIGALMGVGLLLGSYLLLTTIDPSLTDLSPKIIPLKNIAAPKEQVGIDYGRAVTDTTETFIYTIDQIGSQYTATSQKGCERIASKPDYDACMAHYLKIKFPRKSAMKQRLSVA